ncbi:hypothetical protein AAFF_G00268950 [Aldrovandia affinis]|uniref:Uncharacterized protein n=1 Tax=Aldrovandia affinis TaxID=143900 RepID=A0AAD7SSH3_9TELE|nr:hypothetical protein AAFF_G00268950 [Aldrovandia affinis]
MGFEVVRQRERGRWKTLSLLERAQDLEDSGAGARGRTEQGRVFCSPGRAAVMATGCRRRAEKQLGSSSLWPAAHACECAGSGSRALVFLECVREMSQRVSGKAFSARAKVRPSHAALKERETQFTQIDVHYSSPSFVVVQYYGGV